MERKHIASIDVEKCKELFEYEMTEVLLMLKGEFASVSGKDMGYSQYHVSKERRNAPLAAIKKEQISELILQPMTLPENVITYIQNSRRKNADEKKQNLIRNVVVNAPEVSLPNVKLPVIPPITQKQQVESHCPVSVPTVSLCKIQQIPEWNGELPKVRMPEMKEIPVVSAPDIAVTYGKPDIPAAVVTVGAIPEVTYKRIHVQLPDISYCRNPETTAEKTRHAEEKSNIIRKPWENISVPQIPAIEIRPVSVNKYLVSVPDVGKNLQENEMELGEILENR